MQKRLTICIDVDEEDIPRLERYVDQFYEAVVAEIGVTKINWDSCVDRIKGVDHD